MAMLIDAYSSAKNDIGNIQILNPHLEWVKPLYKLVPSSVGHILIHTAAAKTCTAADIHRWHIERGWAGAGYNYFVRKNGEIYEMRGKSVGAHATGWNSKAIGICFEGHGDQESTLPAAQMNSGVKIIKYLMQEYPSLGMNTGKIKTHRWAQGTNPTKTCPGTVFPFSDLVERAHNSLSVIYPMLAKASYDDLGVNKGTVATVVVTPSLHSLSQVAEYAGTTVKTLQLFNNLVDEKVYTGMVLGFPNNATHMALETSRAQAQLAGNFRAGAMEIAANVVNESTAADTSVSGTNVSYFDKDQALFGTATTPNVVTTGKTESLIGADDVRNNLSFSMRMNKYRKFRIRVEMKDRIVTYLFKIDPRATGEQRSRDIQEIKTKGGSIIVDNGKNFATKNISGVVLDYNEYSERIEFLKFYNKYIESGAYQRIYIDIEGVSYMVEITGVSISSTAEDGMVKGYGISLLVLSDNIETVATVNTQAEEMAKEKTISKAIVGLIEAVTNFLS